MAKLLPIDDQVITKLSPIGHQVITKWPPSAHQVIKRSPSDQQLITSDNKAGKGHRRRKFETQSPTASKTDPNKPQPEKMKKQVF